MRVLIVGPSPNRSKGGMATVIREMLEDHDLNEKVELSCYESYIDGHFLRRLLYSIVVFLKFCFTQKCYDVYHIHVASYGSTFRKAMYARVIKRWKKKLIIHVHGARYLVFYSQCSTRKQKRIVYFLQSADRVIALSDDWKNKFEESFGLTNCISVPNGINTTNFISGICDLDEHRREFTFLGRIGERKGVYDLVDAIEEVVKTNPDVKVYIAGDGEVDRLSAIIQEKGLKHNIDVIGWADYSRKITLFKKCATLILPSYNEGLPMAILEAMASGKAIISTTVGAIPEVISEENGVLIQPGDVKALADAIVLLSTDVNLLYTMSENNIRRIRAEFDMGIMHKKILECYDYVSKIR